MKRHIPNAITCGNLICGCLGIQSALSGDLTWAAYFIWIAAIMDFFDGFAARLLKVSSPIGKELDSLADVVSFGVLPGFIIFQMMNQQFSNETCHSTWIASCTTEGRNWLSYVAFVIPALSAYRLAKFNLDTRQSESFIGLPTPANAILISGFPLILIHDTFNLSPILTNVKFLAIFSIIISYILISEIHLIALKFKNYSFGDNKFRYIFLISSLIIALTLNFTAIPIIIIFYVLISIIENLTQKNINQSNN